MCLSECVCLSFCICVFVNVCLSVCRYIYLYLPPVCVYCMSHILYLSLPLCYIVYRSVCVSVYEYVIMVKVSAIYTFRSGTRQSIHIYISLLVSRSECVYWMYYLCVRVFQCVDKSVTI